MPEERLPIIDISPFMRDDASQEEKLAVAQELHLACRGYGFFYIVGHDVDEKLQERLEAVSREFFSLPLEEKMECIGPTWCGYFANGRLLKGRPDYRETLEFGKELSKKHSLYKEDPTSLLCSPEPNLFPKRVPELKQVVLQYVDALTKLANGVVRALALSLGLDENFLDDRYIKGDPSVRFVMAKYPKYESTSAIVCNDENAVPLFGVREHTDSSFITILKQDNSGGLQVKSKLVESKWIEATPIPNSFVCNVGDMLDRMTGGLYRSNVHRVKVQKNGDRYSFPFFLDPCFFVEVKPIDGTKLIQRDEKEIASCWDNQNINDFQGTFAHFFNMRWKEMFHKKL